MSYTNHTTNLELPQYVGTDKPTYLGDFNTAMSTIDTAYASNKALAEGAQTTANTANNTATQAASDASSATSTANAAATAAAQADTKADTALNSAASANTKADTAISNAAANALKIGDLSSLNTTDKTDVVSAINEVNTDYTLLTATGTTPITLPASYKEIVVIVKGTAGGSYTWSFGTFPKTFIDNAPTNSHYVIRTGHYYSTSDYSNCNIFISSTQVTLDHAVNQSNNVTSNAVVEVFYK